MSDGLESEILKILGLYLTYDFLGFGAIARVFFRFAILETLRNCGVLAQCRGSESRFVQQVVGFRVLRF